MKYLKLYESYVLSEEDKIFASIVNMNLINDIKDMALEYIDQGYKLYIKVYNKPSADVITNTTDDFHKIIKIIAELYYDHDRDELKLGYYDYKNLIEWDSKNIDSISYNVYIIMPFDEESDEEFEINEECTKELKDRIILAYPNEIIGDYQKFALVSSPRW